MNTIDILTGRFNELFSEGKYVDDFEVTVFGMKQIKFDHVNEELFGDPTLIVKEFEERFVGKATNEMINHLIKAGMSTLINYEGLLQQEMRAVTPSATEIVCANMNGEMNLAAINDRRKRVSEKWFAVVMAQRELGELSQDLRASGPKLPSSQKRLTNRWFGPLPK